MNADSLRANLQWGYLEKQRSANTILTAFSEGGSISVLLGGSYVAQFLVFSVRKPSLSCSLAHRNADP